MPVREVQHHVGVAREQRVICVEQIHEIARAVIEAAIPSFDHAEVSRVLEIPDPGIAIIFQHLFHLEIESRIVAHEQLPIGILLSQDAFDSDAEQPRVAIERDGEGDVGGQLEMPSVQPIWLVSF